MMGKCMQRVCFSFGGSSGHAHGHEKVYPSDTRQTTCHSTQPSCPDGASGGITHNFLLMRRVLITVTVRPIKMAESMIPSSSSASNNTNTCFNSCCRQLPEFYWSLSIGGRGWT